MGGINLSADVKPIGVNRAYAPARWGKRHGFRKTTEADGYQTVLQIAARRAMRGRPLLVGMLAARIRFVHTNNRSDIDGPIKLSLDALEGVVYSNDRQVRRLEVEYVLGESPRVEIGVVEIAP